MRGGEIIAMKTNGNADYIRAHLHREQLRRSRRYVQLESTDVENVLHTTLRNTDYWV